MSRLYIALAALVLATACSPSDETPATDEPAAGTPTPAEAAPDPTALPTPPQEARAGTINLICGAETFRIAFEDARAVLVNDDGSNTELPKLEPGPDSEPGVTTYTDGAMTFARSAGQDAPVRFARGRAAFQDCAVSQN